MNWDDLRLFLAVARAKSFSAAAKDLGVNQSTVSRRIAELERRLGTQLLLRSREGCTPTAAGIELSNIAGNLEEEFFNVETKVLGRDSSLVGQLRVTCVDIMIDRYLAPVIAGFCRKHPGIALSLRTPLQPLDLMRHEADVAVRVCEKPPDPLVGRRLCNFAIGVYAAPEFVKNLPASPDPSDLHWIGWESESYNHQMITENFPDARISHRVDSFLVARAMVREGIGVSAFPCYWADADEALSRLYEEPLVRDKLGLWILVHPDVRRLARVRAFVDFLAPELLADRARFEGLNAKTEAL